MCGLFFRKQFDQNYKILQINDIFVGYIKLMKKFLLLRSESIVTNILLMIHMEVMFTQRDWYL